MARYSYTPVSQPQDVPVTGCFVIDAHYRSPAGAHSLARSCVVGVDHTGFAATNLGADFAEWLTGSECAELVARAALLGCTLVFGLRDRFSPEREEFRQLARMHRATFGDFDE